MIVQELNPSKADTDEQIIESMKNTLEAMDTLLQQPLWGLKAEQNGRGGFSRKGVKSGGAESRRCLNIS